MKPTFVALFAAALAVASTPAAACDPYFCPERAVADDAYPPGEASLPPSIRLLVLARDDRGLSLAGFYNDPSLALLEYAPPYYSRRRGPHVVRSRY
jgi:hypothetical protein